MLAVLAYFTGLPAADARPAPAGSGRAGRDIRLTTAAVCGLLHAGATALIRRSLRARFPVGESIEVRRRFNVAPGDEVLAVTTDREGHPRGDLLRWGLVPSWAKKPDTGLKMINARVETVAERPAYSRALERFRCLTTSPTASTSGRRPHCEHPGRGPKQGFHITREDGALFAFAGLWSIWRERRRCR